MAVKEATPFKMERLGVIMEPEPGNPREAWGVLNPGGTRGPDGEYYLFPRVVAEGNYSRLPRARVHFAANGDPSGAERLGYALEPHEPYEGPCMAIIHRPTYALHGHPRRPAVIMPPAGAEHLEHIWSSFSPLEH